MKWRRMGLVEESVARGRVFGKRRRRIVRAGVIFSHVAESVNVLLRVAALRGELGIELNPVLSPWFATRGAVHVKKVKSGKDDDARQRS